MPKSAPEAKSAIDALIDSFMRLRDEARERMSEEEFQRAEREFDRIVEKIHARRHKSLLWPN